MLGKMISTLSYGGRQKSIMARTFVNRPLTPTELASEREKHRVHTEVLRLLEPSDRVKRLIECSEALMKYWTDSNGW